MPRKKGSSGSATLDPPRPDAESADSDPISADAVAAPAEPEAPSATVQNLDAPEEGADLPEAALVADEPMAEPIAEIISTVPEPAPAADLGPAIEAILFASPEPVSVKKLADCLESDAKAVREAIDALMAQLNEQVRGIQILEVPGGFQMATREKFSDYIYRLGNKKKRQALSNATLETLAIIAYRQPVIRAVVESVRGVESSGTVRNLLDMGLIEINGYKEVIGRPPMYGTTEKFLRTFGLRTLADLPSIRGLKERFAEDEPPARTQPQFIPAVAVDGPAAAIGAAAVALAAEGAAGAEASDAEANEAGASADLVSESETLAASGPQIIDIAAAAAPSDPLDAAAQQLAERMEAAGDDEDDDADAEDEDFDDEEEFDDEDDDGDEDDDDEDLDDEDEDEFDDDEDDEDADEDDEDLDDEDDDDLDADDDEEEFDDEDDDEEDE